MAHMHRVADCSAHATSQYDGVALRKRSLGGFTSEDGVRVGCVECYEEAIENSKFDLSCLDAFTVREGGNLDVLECPVLAQIDWECHVRRFIRELKIFPLGYIVGVTLQVEVLVNILYVDALGKALFTCLINWWRKNGQASDPSSENPL